MRKKNSKHQTNKRWLSESYIRLVCGIVLALVVLQAALGRREGAPKAVPAVELWHLSGTPTSLKVGGAHGVCWRQQPQVTAISCQVVNCTARCRPFLWGHCTSARCAIKAHGWGRGKAYAWAIVMGDPLASLETSPGPCLCSASAMQWGTTFMGGCRVLWLQSGEVRWAVQGKSRWVSRPYTSISVFPPYWRVLAGEVLDLYAQLAETGWFGQRVWQGSK